MKKTLALLTVAACCVAPAMAAITATSYTIDFSGSAAVKLFEGDSANDPTKEIWQTHQEEVNGKTTWVLDKSNFVEGYSGSFYRANPDLADKYVTFNEMLDAAQAKEGVFNVKLSVNWGGKDAIENFIYFGTAGTGVSFAMVNGGLTFNHGETTRDDSVIAQLTANQWVDVTLQLFGNDLTVTVDGVTHTATLSDITWEGESNKHRNCKYSIGCKAPGWSENMLDGSMIANMVISYGDAVPEPATASLSLLGLAALMMCRRRA